MMIEKQVRPLIGYRRDTTGFDGYFNTGEYGQFTNSPWKHVIHYASSGFEGILGVLGEDGELSLVTLDAHLDRMFRTMDTLLFTKPGFLDGKVEAFHEMFPDKDPTMPVPSEKQKYLEIKRDDVEDHIMKVISKNVSERNIDPNKLVYIRPNFYRDEKRGDVDVEPGLGVGSLVHDVVFEVTALNVPPYLSTAPKTGPRVVVFEEELFRSKNGDHTSLGVGLESPMRKIKAGANYGLGGIVKNLALLYGCEEGLMTDPEGNVLEGGGENAYCVINGELYTPPTDQSILPGTKRELVIEIAQKLGYTVVQQTIPLRMFAEAESAAFSGTWCGFEPIGDLYWSSQKIHTRYNRDNQIIKDIKEGYNHVIRGDSIVDDRLRDIVERVRTPVGITLPKV